MTLVVIRVVYSGEIPVSVTAPASFDGDTAAVRASDYVKKLLARDDTRRADRPRVEYHVLPVGDNSNTARFRSAPSMPIAHRPTIPALQIGQKWMR